MQLDPSDPLLTTKLRALRPLLRSSQASKASIPWADLSVEDCLQAARVLCLREDEALPPGPSSSTGFVNPRNEAAALSLLYQHADEWAGCDGRRSQLDALAATYTLRCSACYPAAATADDADDADDADALTAAPEGGGGPEEELLRWAASQGADVARVRPAAFGGGALRGLAVTRAVAAGDAVLRVPAALLITAATAAGSDLGRMLRRLPGMEDDESLLVVWTMVERWEPEAAAAPFWRALPRRLDTGLSQPDSAWDLVAGTSARRQHQHAYAHVMRQYDALQPVFKTLLAAHPDYFQPAWFAPEAYLWAVELWYAYAMQVQFPDGRVAPALAPVASLVNHGPAPHVVHYSSVDPGTGQLALRCFRPLERPGQQLLLSYGPLSNEHLLLFYGFAVPGNPFDSLQVDLLEALSSQQQRQRRDAERALRAGGLPSAFTLTRWQPLPPGLERAAEALAACGALPTGPGGPAGAALRGVLRLLRQPLEAAAARLRAAAAGGEACLVGRGPFRDGLLALVQGQLQLLDRCGGGAGGSGAGGDA